MYRFYFEDTLEPVEWIDSPDYEFGPWETQEEALDALEDDPSKLGYLLCEVGQEKNHLGYARPKPESAPQIVE